MKNNKAKIVWLSSNLLGYEMLKEAVKISGIEVKAIIILKSTAKTVMYDGVERNKWNTFGLPVYEIEDINKETRLFSSLNPDIVVMCGWRQIIEKEILLVPKLAFLGFHPTLLPKGRGPAPLINTILEGFDKSGLTMFSVKEGLDDGDIVGQSEFLIGPDDTVTDLYQKIIKAGRNIIKRYLPLVAKKTASSKTQDNSTATYFTKRTLKDNEIDLHDSPEDIYRKIRALAKPYKGAYLRLGDKKLVIWKAELE